MSLIFLFLFSLLSSSLSQIPYDNTANCNITVCNMTTNCRCLGFDIPGNLSWDKTPQFIFFTLDDSMYEADFNRMFQYSWILQNDSIHDSLNCSVKPTWYAMEICKNTIYINKTLYK